MADQFIALDEPAVTDKKLDSSELTVGANTVQRERINIADPTSAAGIAPVTAAGGLKVDLGTDNDVTITSGTVTTITNVVHVDDNAGSLTVDNPTISVVGGGVEATAQRVTIASDSTGVLSVDDNGGNLSIDDGGNSITVDGTVATSNFPTTVDTNSGLKSASTLRVVLATDQPALTNKLLVTPDSVALPANQSVNVNQLAGTATSVNSGTKDAGTLRVVIATDQPALTNKLLVTPDAVTHDVGSITTAVVPGTGATNLGKAEDAAHTSGDVGVMALGVRKATPTDLSAGATDADYEPIQISKNGGVWASMSAEAQGGWSVATGSIAATKTDIGTANTAGCVGGWYFYNSNASVAYVQFFNTQASGVTLGTTPPVYSLGIPATSAANLMCEAGIQHSTAISIAVTTTRAGSTGTGSTVDYNIWFKQ
jgi:hypothetical protein